jgi:O6-methylguanine-DNA--protein-cysteine methyltransferase
MIHLASSVQGAAGIGLSLGREGHSLSHFHHRFPHHRLVRSLRRNSHLIAALASALKGQPISENLALDIQGTPFQMLAWKTIQKIPFGETRAYGEVARMIGKPGGARAIGQAMGRNPLPIIFP